MIEVVLLIEVVLAPLIEVVLAPLIEVVLAPLIEVVLAPLIEVVLAPLIESIVLNLPRLKKLSFRPPSLRFLCSLVIDSILLLYSHSFGSCNRYKHDTRKQSLLECIDELRVQTVGVDNTEIRLFSLALLIIIIINQH